MKQASNYSRKQCIELPILWDLRLRLFVEQACHCTSFCVPRGTTILENHTLSELRCPLWVLKRSMLNWAQHVSRETSFRKIKKALEFIWLLARRRFKYISHQISTCFAIIEWPSSCTNANVLPFIAFRKTRTLEQSIHSKDAGVATEVETYHFDWYFVSSKVWLKVLPWTDFLSEPALTAKLMNPLDC